MGFDYEKCDNVITNENWDPVTAGSAIVEKHNL